MTDKKIRAAGHLEEKRGIYQIILSWQSDGRRHRKSISTRLCTKGNKRRAEDMLMIACKLQQEKLENFPIKDMSFSDCLELWLFAIKPELKPTTFGNYQNAVKRIIVPYFRDKELMMHEVTATDILDFYTIQLEKVKATTVHKYHNIFSRAFQYAVENNFIKQSPLEKVKRPRAERYGAKFLKEGEIIALFEAVKGHKLELGVILAVYYGLRRGEIVGLRWDSIDFEKNTITIEHTVTIAQSDGKKVTVVGDTAKTLSSLRTLPLIPQFHTMLLSLKSEKEHCKKLCGKSYNKKEGQYVYTDEMGNRISPDYLTQQFPLFMEKNGFRRIRFHDLRHSCAGLLLSSGVSLKQIQEWLGHSSFKTTAEIYAHLDYESKIAITNSVDWITQTSLGK